jgi:hypothetical protein
MPMAAMSQSQSHEMCTTKATMPAWSATRSGRKGSRRPAKGLRTDAAMNSAMAAVKRASPTVPSSLSTLNH